MKITITRESIIAEIAEGACEERLVAFDTAYPDGVLEYDPTSHEDAARILSGPLAQWWSWAVEAKLAIPFQLMAGPADAGDYGTSVAGHYGIAKAGYRGAAMASEGGTATAGDVGLADAGDYGTSVSGRYGTAKAGYRGAATAGDYGTSKAGDGGTSKAGCYGTATVGDYGTAAAGLGGIIAIYHYDTRLRLIVGYIEETLDAAGEALEADTPYRLNGEGQFVRAE